MIFIFYYWSVRGKNDLSEDNGQSSKGMYISNTSRIPLNWKDIRNIAYMNELYEIVLEIERKPEGEECLKYHTT